MRFTLNADGAQAAGQGIGSIFKAMAMAPMVRQQAEQDAIKSAADIYYRQMAGNKYGAEAEGLRMTNTARQATIDPSLPDYIKAAKRAFQDTGDTNMENYAKAVQLMQRVGNVDNVIANPTQAPAVGQAYAATQGKPLFDAVGNTGVSLNQFTGQQTTTSPELMDLFSRVQKSIWNENNAQAGQANAAAGKYNAEAGLVGDKRKFLTEKGALPGSGAEGSEGALSSTVIRSLDVPMLDAKGRPVTDAFGKTMMQTDQEALKGFYTWAAGNNRKPTATAFAQWEAQGRPDGNKNPPPAQASQKMDAQAAALAKAREAMAKGAPRDKVIERLRQNGIDPTGL